MPAAIYITTDTRELATLLRVIAKNIASCADAIELLEPTPPRKRQAASLGGTDDGTYLQRVAEVYLSATRAPTQAVADAFDIAHRTGVLYVRRARDAGLIPPVGGIHKTGDAA